MTTSKELLAREQAARDELAAIQAARLDAEDAEARARVLAARANRPEAAEGLGVVRFVNVFVEADGTDGDTILRALRLTRSWREVYHAATEYEGFGEGCSYVFSDKPLDDRGDAWDWVRDAFPGEGDAGVGDDEHGPGEFTLFEVDFDEVRLRGSDGSML